MDEVCFAGLINDIGHIQHGLMRFNGVDPGELVKSKYHSKYADKKANNQHGVLRPGQSRDN